MNLLLHLPQSSPKGRLRAPSRQRVSTTDRRAMEPWNQTVPPLIGEVMKTTGGMTCH